MPRLLKTFLITVLLAASTALSASAPALADVTSSTITTPSNPSYYMIGDGAPTTFTVSGTTSGATAGDTVDLLCFYGDASHYYSVATDVPITLPAGTFSASGVSLTTLNTTCELRAVPSGTTDNVANFSGPDITISGTDNATVINGPNNGDVDGFFVGAQNSGGGDLIDAVGGCSGDGTGMLLADSAWYWTSFVFGCTADLFGTTSELGLSRSLLQVDGQNAYTPSAAGNLWQRSGSCPTSCDGSEDVPGLPTANATVTQNPATGAVTVNETDPIVRCSGSGTFPPTSAADCPSFTPTGVVLRRTVEQSAAGRMLEITDSWASTDGHIHALNLMYITFAPLALDPTDLVGDNVFELPGQSSYAAHGDGYTYTPAPGPGTIFVKNAAVLDGDPYTGQGAFTYATAPDGIEFLPTTAGDTSVFTTNYAGTVPATGSLTYRFVVSEEYTTAGLLGEALPAQDAFTTPTISLQHPHGRTTVHAHTLTVRGRAADPVKLSKVAVDGRVVAVTAGGAFTATITLHRGINRLEAVATNEAGNSVAATALVTYHPAKHRSR